MTEFDLPKGYVLVPLTKKEHHISTDGVKYGLYYYSNLIGIVFADKQYGPEKYMYSVHKWDYTSRIVGYDIQELLTNYCTQHKMGLVK